MLGEHSRVCKDTTWELARSGDGAECLGVSL